MRHILASTLSAALALALLCSCSSSDSQTTVIPSDPSEVTESVRPTDTPSPEPTLEPSEEPSAEPSEEPSQSAEPDPAAEPSQAPAATPSPTPKPTPSPTPTPTPAPTPAPTSAPTPDPAPDPTPDPAPAPDGVDLAAFYEDITGKYEFGFLQLASQELVDGFYPGLTGIDTEQCLVYVCMISMNNGEFGLVQVSDSADVDAVKAIFQARIDYMVGDGNGPGGAQYPMAMDQWENNSRVISNGNYVMMVIHENCDDIVSQFNALF